MLHISSMQKEQVMPSIICWAGNVSSLSHLLLQRAVLWGALVGQLVLFQGQASVAAVSYFSHFVTLQVIAPVLKEHDWPCC